MASHPTPAHGAADAAHHVHGTMDTREQERTFNGFLRLSAWAAVVVICILIFLALVNL